eukprot:scaffold17839_cov120-Isochrysis_galbana.AAC.6
MRELRSCSGTASSREGGRSAGEGTSTREEEGQSEDFAAGVKVHNGFGPRSAGRGRAGVKYMCGTAAPRRLRTSGCKLHVVDHRGMKEDGGTPLSVCHWQWRVV